MSKYINPFTDFGFKKLFGTEINKDLLIDFLNTILPEEATIKNLTYLPTEQLGDGAFQRKAIFDVYCENERGEKFIVEMQKAEQDYFKDRSIFYSTFPIRDQAKRGQEWDFELKAVYTVGVLDFVFDYSPLDDEVVHHEVQLFDKQTNRVFYNKLTYVYLELPKFRKTEAELETNFDRWMYLLNHMQVLDRCPASLRTKLFEKAFKTAEIAKYNSAEQRTYEESLKVYRDLINVVKTAERKGLEKGLEKGREKGREEGREEGLEEGLEKGLEKGREEGIEKGMIEGRKVEQQLIAANFKKQGIVSEVIAQCTGLSIEEIDLL